jgi:S1-C subfamily serine protease
LAISGWSLGWGPRVLLICIFLTLLAAPAVRAQTSAEHFTPTRTELDSVDSVQIAVRQVYRLLVEFEGAIKGGTAFLVSGSRIIATNHHVIEGGKSYSVGFIDENGTVKRVPLRVIAIFPQKDLALLEALDSLPGQPLPLADGYPAVATDLFAIGFPAAADPRGGLSWAQSDDTTFFIPSVLKGYVSRVLTNRWFSSQLQHQTPIIPGYSGGPLINSGGAVLGISTAIHKDANGISYGVLAGDLADLLEACTLPVDRISDGSRPRTALRKPITTEPEMPKPQVRLEPADEEMMARGYDFLERGDIVAARLVFRYLVDKRNLHQAYSGLAKTYDPLFLNKKKVIGVSGDAEKARALYEKAASFAEPASGSAASGCTNSICNLVNSPGGPAVLCQSNATAMDMHPTAHRP